jgi:hypothetical protein
MNGVTPLGGARTRGWPFQYIWISFQCSWI